MNLTQPTAPPIVVDLHGLKLAFQSPDLPLRERFEEVYGHLPHLNGAGGGVFIGWHIHKLPSAPPPPPGMPVIAEGPLVGYYGQGQLVAIRMPKYGLITVDLDQQRLVGAVTRNTLEAYGAFEDVLLISLAPLYRRRGWFPLHAFAALAPTGKVALISGQMGAGKTTTGLALLSAGWKLLSNDSPLLTLRADGQVKVLAYPGRLSAFDDSLVRFEGLRRFIPEAKAEATLKGANAEPKAPYGQAEQIDLLAPAGPQKRVFRAEEAFAEPWADSGVAGGIFFPQVIPGLGQSELVEVSPREAVLQLMPQAIEGWDKAAIGQTLHLLGKLVEQAPCYQLRLSPQVEQLPALIAGGMEIR
ncbi:MAG: hypothetical protein BroJett011_47730 [Chloroflexota bacterium]|nr:MAG: hypothetical protein BroJett011_47730 [Chloroflexota bacterium]